jgi:hypothetical protein
LSAASMKSTPETWNHDSDLSGVQPYARLF